MSYKLETAYVLGRYLGDMWMEKDISTIPSKDLFANYQRVILGISHTYFEETRFLDLDELRGVAYNYPEPITVILNGLSGTPLNFLSELPIKSIRYVKYENARRLQYKSHLRNAGNVYPENYPEAEYRDIELTRDVVPTNMSSIHKYALTTVNGYFHRTTTDGKRFYILDGGTTHKVSHELNIGLASFKGIGSLKQIPLKDISRYAMDDNNGLKGVTVFDFEDEDLEDKTVLLVVGGYLVLPKNGAFWKGEANTYNFNISSIQLPERVMESLWFLDMTSVLPNVDIKNTTIEREYLYSDEFLNAYFDMSQSFAVVVDAKRLAYFNYNIQYFRMPGSFRTYQEPTDLMMAGYGRAPEYWKEQGREFWHINTSDSLRRNFILSDKNPKNNKLYSPQLHPSKPTFASNGMLLRIGGYQEL